MPAGPPPDVDYRFILANERTFLAWIRTSLGIIAGGVALDQFVVVGGSKGAIAPLAVAIIVLGAVVAVTGTIRWKRVDSAMRAHRGLRTSRGVMIVGSCVAVVAVVVGLLLVFG